MTDSVADLIAQERHAREQRAIEAAQSEWTKIRRDALLELHRKLGTWQKVADATGQKLPTVHKAANQPRKKEP